MKFHPLLAVWIAVVTNYGMPTHECLFAEDRAAVRPASTEAAQDAQRSAQNNIEQLGGRVRPMHQNASAWRVDFHLRGRELRDEGLRFLKDLGPVESLNLRDTQITDAGLESLRPLKELRWLHLERTPIGDAGIASLRHLKQLEYLNLYGTQLTDRGLSDLAGLSKLRKLYVWQTKVTPAGIAKLKAQLPNLEVEEGVDLSTLPKYEPKPEAPLDPEEDLAFTRTTDRAAAPRSETGLNTKVIFENQSGQPVKLFWVSYNDELKLYAELAIKASHQQNTYARNTWLVTNRSEQPLGYFVVGTKVGRAVIPPTKP